MNRFVARVEPEESERRHLRARAVRRVETTPEVGDGMGSLHAELTGVDVAAVDARLTQIARAAGADDPRTMDQRRADALVDLLLGRTGAQDGQSQPAGVAVAVTVPAQTLLGLCATPPVSGRGGVRFSV